LLKKKVCKLCHKENGRCWNDFNDWAWEDGHVRCPAVYYFSLAESLKRRGDKTEMYAETEKPPPKNCFFKLEQEL